MPTGTKTMTVTVTMSILTTIKTDRGISSVYHAFFEYKKRCFCLQAISIMMNEDEVYECQKLSAFPRSNFWQ